MLNILFGDQSGQDVDFFNDVMEVMDDISEFSSHKRMEQIFSSKYDRFLRDYAQNNQDNKLPPSFLLQIQDAIAEKENNTIEYHEIWEMLIGLLNGAMETEVNTLMWTLACLAINPGVQEEAFQEIDELCKNKPTFDDEADLPYISAIINESLRYRPPTPFGFAHVSNKDDEYNGCFIPKNTPQFDFDSGIEAEMRNKRNSLKGLLKNNSPSLTNSSMPMHMSFGAGRRYCIGQHLAQKQLFLAIAYILWAFEIKPGVGDDGITPLNININDGNLSLTSFSPYPYKVRFVLRKDIGLLI